LAQEPTENTTTTPTSSPAAAVDIYGDPLPTGAVARLGTIRFRTDSGLHAAMHSADGKWLIGIAEHAICYWNADDGRLDAKIPIEKQNVQHAAISDDRRWCCTYGFFVSDDHTLHSHTLSIWKLDDRRLERTIEVDREAQPSCLAITADGALIALGNRQGQLSIYETASGAELLSAAVSGGDLSAIRFSPADQRIVAIGYNSPLWVWDWENGAEPVSVPELNGRFESIDVSPDGTYVAVGMGGPHGLQLRRMADWSRVDLPGLTGNYRWVQAAAFSPDGQFLATADYIREAVTLRDLSTGKVIHEWAVRPEHIRHLSFSADSQWLVTGSDWSATPPRIWNTRTGEPHEFTETRSSFKTSS
jgi:WD40 repeat protein